LQKYGVSKAFRTISNKDKEIVKVKSASVSYEEGEEGFFDEDEDEEIVAGEKISNSSSNKAKGGVGGLLGNFFSSKREK